MSRLLLLASLAALSFGPGCGCTTVESGFTGVELVWGEVQEQPVLPGFKLFNVFSTDVVKVTNKVQKMEATASASSKDLQVVSTKLALNFKLDPTKTVEVYKTIGDLPTVVSTIVEPALQESMKKSTAMFTAAELVTQRARAKNAITEDIRTTLSKSNILVTEVSVTDFQFDRQYQDAVEAKQIAEQKAQQAKNDLERIRVEAEQVEARAAGKARATLVEAEAEAKAQALLRETLTPAIVQLRAVEKWDGKQPQFVGSDQMFFNITP